MESRDADMQATFSELSEKNKDIIILVAKSVKSFIHSVPFQQNCCIRFMEKRTGRYYFKRHGEAGI